MMSSKQYPDDDIRSITEASGSDVVYSMSSKDTSELRQALKSLDIEFLHGVPVQLPDEAIDAILALLAAQKQRWAKEAKAAIENEIKAFRADEGQNGGLNSEMTGYGAMDFVQAALDGVVGEEK